MRYQDPQDSIAFAYEKEGTWYQLKGHLPGQVEKTDKRAEVAKILAPINPSVILCIGLNYKEHA